MSVSSPHRWKGQWKQCHSTLLTFLAHRGLGAEQNVWNSTELVSINHTSATPSTSTPSRHLPIPLLWSVPSDRPNSPLHSIPENPEQHLTPTFPAAASVCLSWSSLFNATLTQTQELPFLEYAETESTRLGSPDLVIKSAAIISTSRAPQTRIPNTQSFWQHFLGCQVPGNSRSTGLGYGECSGLVGARVLEIESIVSLGKTSSEFWEFKELLEYRTFLETEARLLFCWAVGGKWGGGMTVIWGFLFLQRGKDAEEFSPQTENCRIAPGTKSCRDNTHLCCGWLWGWGEGLVERTLRRVFLCSLL